MVFGAGIGEREQIYEMKKGRRKKNEEEEEENYLPLSFAPCAFQIAVVHCKAKRRTLESSERVNMSTARLRELAVVSSSMHSTHAVRLSDS